MCKMKSGIILKDRVFLPDYDNHTSMLQELGIEDTHQNAERLFVRAELLPPDHDILAPVEEWVFLVNQDILPEWYVEKIDKSRMISAVKEWIKKHIHIGVKNLRIFQGSNHYIKDCENVEIYGNASIKKIFGHTTINSIENDVKVKNVFGDTVVENIYGTVENLYGRAMVKNIYGTVKNIYGRVTIENIYGTVDNVCGRAVVENVGGRAVIMNARDNAVIKTVKDRATVIGSQYGWRNKKTMVISENATFKDCETKTIYQSGDWKLVNI